MYEKPISAEYTELDFQIDSDRIPGYHMIEKF